MFIVDPHAIIAINDDRLLAAEQARVAHTAAGSARSANAAFRALWPNMASHSKPGGRWGRRRYTIRDVPLPQ